LNRTAAALLIRAARDLEPARVSCDAAYSAPCARTNSQWLAVNSANAINQRLEQHLWQQQQQQKGFSNELFNQTLQESWDDINNGTYNMDTGFYPFVFDTEGMLAANGGAPELAGYNLDDVFNIRGVGFTAVDALIDRMFRAASKGGGWVRYMWSDEGEEGEEMIVQPRNKVAYVVGLLDERYVLGVGYENRQFPPDLPCTAEYDSWCSITNVRSLIGKAQTLVTQAESIPQFENAVYELSFNADEYQLPGGFYTFMYGYDGILRGHGLAPYEIGMNFADIMAKRNLTTAEEADAVHRTFVAAAEGKNGGWTQYPWRNEEGEPSFTKVALFVKITFEGNNYYLGAGFTFATQAHLDESTSECTDDYNLPCAFETALHLSSHALTHAISSPLPRNEVFHAISTDPSFHVNDFYVFVIDFNSTNVSHGDEPHYSGMSLSHIFELNNISMNADRLHELFMKAAESGGGWVLYDWRIPGDEGRIFPKIAYLFQITLEGENFYGGVGFNHERAPVQYFAADSYQMDGTPVSCTYLYGTECSSTNAHAILGQAIGELTLASSEARISRFSPAELQSQTVESVMKAITNRNPNIVVNDFYVSLFSAKGDEEICTVQDGSGCCLAHGENSSFVGMTWQQILNQKGITSISGMDLHNDLVDYSHRGRDLTYPYSGDIGEARTKHAVIARFRHAGKSYYALSEYFNTPPPPTCDKCPLGMGCTEPSQSYCEDLPDTVSLPSIVPWILAIATVAAASFGLFYWYKRRNFRKRKSLALKIEKMEGQLKNLVQIAREIPLPCENAVDYKARFGQRGVEKVASPYLEIDWGWEEDMQYLDMYDPSEVMTGSTYVKYSEFASSEIEKAYQKWITGNGAPRFRLDLTYRVEKVHNPNSGYCYIVDFQTMKQYNAQTNHSRGVRREELLVEITSEIVSQLPALPDDIDFFSKDGEDFLPTLEGQVIQIAKEHPDKEWLYGSIVYDPLLAEARKNEEPLPVHVRKVISKALHDRPTSGWFPVILSNPAEPDVLKKIMANMGEGAAGLKKPETWEPRKEGILAVPSGSAEYDNVVHFFLDTLHHHRQHVQVVGVQRIQSFPLWQSYAVKKETTKKRDMRHPEHLINNKDPKGLERQWLFHGTTTAAIPKIIKQGFNRAFAGRNAVAYGKGVYFARYHFISRKCWSVAVFDDESSRQFSIHLSTK